MCIDTWEGEGGSLLTDTPSSDIIDEDNAPSAVRPVGVRRRLGASWKLD